VLAQFILSARIGSGSPYYKFPGHQTSGSWCTQGGLYELIDLFLFNGFVGIGPNTSSFLQKLQKHTLPPFCVLEVGPGEKLISAVKLDRSVISLVFKNVLHCFAELSVHELMVSILVSRSISGPAPGPEWARVGRISV
jgi:hypothetical protein